MRNFHAVLARVQAFKTKFEDLLESARRTARPGVAPARVSRLGEVKGFGANPGNLRMFSYAPKGLPPNAPLVVALHGCTQSADDYDYGTGWSSLADKFGFAVIFPQQQPAKNPRSCFSWFLRDDIARGKGEARSIREMVEHAIATFASDRSRIFVTGLSAGGAMASVMLATYPEVFAGGAIIAGLPYGRASNVQQAFELMFTPQAEAAPALGDTVRAASRHRGPWPKISVWHGTNDPIVQPSNAENIIRQWSNVHGLPESPSYQEPLADHTRRIWSDANGEALIEAFSISGMAHGVPLATRGGESCGACGPFFLDVGISSSYHIARFWHLHKCVAEMPRATSQSAANHIPIEDRDFVLVRPSAAASDSSAEHSDQNQQTQYTVDPNAVIAAAFRTAGLPVADFPNAQPGAIPRVASGPIIEAAFKAARRLANLTSDEGG